MQQFITESHLPDSPKLMAIARAQSKNKSFLIDGFPYEIHKVDTKPGRIEVTMRLVGCTK